MVVDVFGEEESVEVGSQSVGGIKGDDRVGSWAGLWWKMSRLIVSMVLARTLAQTQTQTHAQAQAQTQGPRGTGLRQGKALQSPGKRKRQRSRECEIDDEELKMMMRLRSRFSHEFFFSPMAGRAQFTKAEMARV